MGDSMDGLLIFEATELEIAHTLHSISQIQFFWLSFTHFWSYREVTSIKVFRNILIVRMAASNGC